ncbi:RAB [Nesidiocoris tenuis]|uniref:Ras-related protein Rab n=1 Tax=Nesidiocoris tenuis TaxID=355587 RepID=A0ABN7AKD1_9HEMI|nr:RAB [Nesidiocoris tenuis]
MSGVQQQAQPDGTMKTKKKKKGSPKEIIKKLSLTGRKKKPKEEPTKIQENITASQETLCSLEDSPKRSPAKDEPEASGVDGAGPSPLPDAIPPENPPLDPLQSMTITGDVETQTEEGTVQPPYSFDFPTNDPWTKDGDSTSMDTATSTEIEVGGSSKKECLYKILVIGEIGTGKTSIIKRYVHQFFSQHYRATIGVDFALKVLNWDQNTVIRLQLWDIAGQERFGNMTRVYFKEAVGAFIVFDVTRAATFEAVLKWKQDLDAKVQLPDGSPVPCVLLANKCDQPKEGLANQPNKMNDYCEEHKFTAWFETSAKENINIEDAAKTLISQILANDTSHNSRTTLDSSKFPLDGGPDEQRKQVNCNC